MTVTCHHCNSSSVQSRGTKTNASGNMRRSYQCNSCSKWFSVPMGTQNETSKVVAKYSSTMPEEFKNYDRYVISAVQNDTAVNEEFLQALENYCGRKMAKLILVPIKYKFNDQSVFNVDSTYLVEDSVLLNKKLQLLAHIQINPTIETPVAGLDYLSKGSSLIIAHTQLQMRTVATLDDSPAILHTTGAISYPNYAVTKTGEKARFNHSMSALVIEKNGDQFHLRVLNCDEDSGFYDIDGYYVGDSFTELDYVEAIVTGDEHAIFMDEDVKAATYTNTDSMVNTLKPKRIVRHDVLDFFSGSHHHQHSFLLQYAKHHTKTNLIEDELIQTLRHIADTTPASCENIMVQSNHVEHLNKWLDSVDPKFEVWNAHLYYRMMMLMIDHIEKSEDISVPNAFQLWVEKTDHEFDVPVLRWLGRNESYKVHGIELANHGDVGINGSRGSPGQYSKLPVKVIVGHSHSASICKGAYTVGTSTGRLEYCKGPSSWVNAHVIIHKNGKRQMIFIINGAWRN